MNHTVPVTRYLGFGLRSGLGSNAIVPIIPNIGSRCSLGVNPPHIAFQKITCPSGSLRNVVNYFQDGTKEAFSKPNLEFISKMWIRAHGKARRGHGHLDAFLR
jgi:hypothetical protein